MINKIKRVYNQNKRGVLFSVALLTGIVATGKNLSEVLSFVEKYNPLSEENSNPPIEIGMKITEVEDILGQPQEVGFISKSYFSHGIEINPDYESPEEVGGITVKRLPSGIMYKGKIDDIRLNDSVEEIKEAKGAPTYWGIDSPESSTAIWYENDFLTIVHFTANKDEIWTADSIIYTKSASFVAYRAILLSVFQELKAGRVSQFAEELAERGRDKDFNNNDLGMLSLESFSRQYLHQDYEFVLMKPALGGGAEIYLSFGDKLLYFWIYPLGWEKPTVRAIVDLEQYHKNFGT